MPWCQALQPGAQAEQLFATAHCVGELSAADALLGPEASLQSALVARPFPSQSQAKILCTDQLVPTTPRSLAANPPEPLGFHNSVSPLVLRHRIPDWPLPLKSPVPAICQLAANDAQILADEAAEPLGFHNSVSPLVLRHRMLSLPVPVKSPVPAICQLVGDDAQILAR